MRQAHRDSCAQLRLYRQPGGLSGYAALAPSSGASSAKQTWPLRKGPFSLAPAVPPLYRLSPPRRGARRDADARHRVGSASVPVALKRNAATRGPKTARKRSILGSILRLNLDRAARNAPSLSPPRRADIERQAVVADGGAAGSQAGRVGRADQDSSVTALDRGRCWSQTGA